MLLVRPAPPNERFGLGPFFRVEPLGLEYVAQALLTAGHETRIVDMRFSAPLPRVLRRFRPGLVGISCSHTLDVNAALAVAGQIRRVDRSIFTLVGGHAAAAFPQPLLHPDVDGLCACDGEVLVPTLASAIERGQSPRGIPGFWLRHGDEFLPPIELDPPTLDEVPRPARSLVAPLQRHYRCVQKMPLWALETTRGCPYRCSFCSIWRLHRRRFRLRSIPAVCDDFAATGKNVFIVDDLFFYPPARSLELAYELRRRGVRKEWILVQSRLDTVARHPQLLEAWRPLAKCFDIFFGFEAPQQDQLNHLSKDMRLESMEAGVAMARAFRYGVTGNFVIDPDWGEGDFEALWDLVDRLHLEGAGYTILTPLPGTPFFDEVRQRIREWDWSHYDMHHLPWEPRLGRQHFFELFAETWRRSILNPARSYRRWHKWLRGLTWRQLLMFAGAMRRTRRLMDVDAYMAEAFPLQIPAAVDQASAER